MAAKWQRNELEAAERNCDLIIVDANGTMAPPGTDFIAAGAVFVSGATAPDCALALGTLTNKRRPLVVADDVVEAHDAGADTLTLTGHSYETGDGPFDCNETLGAIAIGADFWIRKIDANTIAVYPTLADAYADTNRAALTGTETGATISDNADTKRGIWGHFTYQASQPETDHANPETAVIVDGQVDGLDFRRMNGGGAYTTVTMESSAASTWDEVIENGYTARQLLRGIARQNLARRTKVGNVETTRDLADSKDSHSGTVTSTERTSTIHSLT